MAFDWPTVACSLFINHLIINFATKLTERKMSLLIEGGINLLFIIGHESVHLFPVVAVTNVVI